MLRQIDTDLWEARRPLRLLGANLGSRMIVIRLEDGSLFVHSPIRLVPAIKDQLKELGPVRHVVAPNKMHHLFIKAYRSAFPEARLYAAPGLPEKRKDIEFDEILSDVAPESWAGQIDQHLFAGMPSLNETVFFHRRSRTLLLTDLAFNIQDVGSTWDSIALRLNDSYRRFGPSRFARLLVRNRKTARRSLETILSWQPERITVAHGEILPGGGAEALRRAYAWM